MKWICLAVLQLFAIGAVAQDKVDERQIGKLWLEEVQEFQQELNEKFADADRSPLKKADRLEFESLEFFAPDDRFRVRANFVRTVGEKPFKMPTTTDRMADFVKYGELRFDLGGQSFVLNVYQILDSSKPGEKPESLFLPFTDATNGESTYGGGRYIDLPVPKKDIVVLDFNKAYNPYCTYNEKYSCPIPPKSNHIDLKVRAGVKAFTLK